MAAEDKLINLARKLVTQKQIFLAETGGYFNIFSILGMASNEVKTHCMFLYQLLDPEGCHCQSNKFLKAFFDLVLHKPFPESGKVKVFREFYFNGNDSGRIDLLIEGADFCYPIEVKIFAGDQERQIERYANFASNTGKSNAQVYYLTLSGASPSNNSLGTLKIESIVKISFTKHIKDWMTECRDMVSDIPAIAEVLTQYIKLIDVLTGERQEGEIMELQKVIGATKESFESALAIESALPKVKANMVKRVFGEIEKHIAKTGLTKIDGDYVEKADLYYQETRSRIFPSLSYLLSSANGIEFALKFEIEDRLYYGVAYFKKENEKYFPISRSDNISDNIKVMLDPFKKCNPTEQFLWWEYLPDSLQRMDFKNCDSGYVKLFDEKLFVSIMAQIESQIDEFLKQINIEENR